MQAKESNYITEDKKNAYSVKELISPKVIHIFLYTFLLTLVAEKRQKVALLNNCRIQLTMELQGLLLLSDEIVLYNWIA